MKSIAPAGMTAGTTRSASYAVGARGPQVWLPGSTRVAPFSPVNSAGEPAVRTRAEDQRR